MPPIYLDNNATTPIDPLVRDAMLPYFAANFGNPSSTHVYGKEAARAVQIARGQVASLLNTRSSRIVFTGGGTEASNQVILGTAFAHGFRDIEILTSNVEHPATYATCAFVAKLGVRVTQLPVDRFGQLDPDDVRRAINPRVKLISVMHSHNELGTLMPIREIAGIARSYGIPMHADAAQSVGKVPIDVEELGIDYLTVAGHKLYAPKGVGALYVRQDGHIPSLLHGAGHEHGRRAGTENVPYLVGLGVAAELAETGFPESEHHLRRLRDRLQTALAEHGHINGHPTERLPNTLNISFRGHLGYELLTAVPEIAASTGAACHEGQHLYSPVFDAIGAEREVALGAVRLSVGRFTTEADVDAASEAFFNALNA